MAKQHPTLFTTVRNEGLLLSNDFLYRIASYDPDLAGLTPTAYHRYEQLPEVVAHSWNNLLKMWGHVHPVLRDAHVSGRTVPRAIQQQWLQQVFDELNYGQLSPAQPLEIDGRRFSISHQWNQMPIHLISPGETLDKRQSQGKLHYSPHMLVQQYINAASRHPWGMVSNGLSLRLLRKNMHMTRQSYLEFDLEAMMQSEVYADFVLFWLLCHQSRLEYERSEGCWLEQWSHVAQKEGIRVLERHSSNVVQAIVACGQGFLACPANKRLHQKLREGALSSMAYYQQLLRLVYRLIVLFVAEDRDVLFHPDADKQAQKRYQDYYSTARLRSLADRTLGTPHVDLFRGLRAAMQQLGQPGGCPELGLSPLNGFLFSKKALPDLEDCDLANSDLLSAVRALCFAFDGKTRQRVNYKAIGSEELGSVYEELLELHPVLNVDNALFKLQEGKATPVRNLAPIIRPLIW